MTGEILTDSIADRESPAGLCETTLPALHPAWDSDQEPDQPQGSHPVPVPFAYPQLRAPLEVDRFRPAKIVLAGAVVVTLVLGLVVSGVQQARIGRGIVASPVAAVSIPQAAGLLKLPVTSAAAPSSPIAAPVSSVTAPTVAKATTPTVAAAPVMVKVVAKPAVVPAPVVKKLAAVPAPKPAAKPAPAVSAPKAGLGARIVAAARTYFGVPYRFGGNTRRGIDCSGLVVNVMRDVGVGGVPRQSSAIFSWTRHISRSQLMPGDLVFGADGGPIHHVGIYIGGNQMIDAADWGIPVQVHTLYRDIVFFGRVPA